MATHRTFVSTTIPPVSATGSPVRAPSTSADTRLPEDAGVGEAIFRDQKSDGELFPSVPLSATLPLAHSSVSDAPAALRAAREDESGATTTIAADVFRERAEAVSGSVWRVLRRFGVPAHDVEDCFQSVLLQLHARWDRLVLLPQQELRSYACCVAIGVARGAARARQRTDRAAGDLTDELVAEGTPESHAERQEALEQLDAVLATLSDERREVFVLYELEGLTGAEIAQHLDLPPGTVASRLRRARADFEAAASRLLNTTRRNRA